MSMPSDGSERPVSPGLPGFAGTRSSKRAAAGLAALSGLALAGWMIVSYLHRPQSNALDESMSSVGTSSVPNAAELAADRYNAVLQVRVEHAQGEMAVVGTTLPRRLTLTLHDEAGRVYAEVFDRVGLWAIEVPPGTYLIPLDQPDLARWKWVLTGDGITRVAGKGYSVVFAAGRVNPTIDLLLK